MKVKQLRGPTVGGNRAKASRLRARKRAGEALSAVDELWLANYDDDVEARAKKKNGAGDVGASRSSRKMTIDLDETSEAIGSGSAAAAAAGAALVAREEGRRLDNLTITSIDALKEACAVYKDICLTLKDRTEVLEATHIAMLDSVRAHFLARTDAEVRADELERQAESGGKDDMMTMLVPMLAAKLGLQVPAAPTAAPAPAGRGKTKR